MGGDYYHNQLLNIHSGLEIAIPQSRRIQQHLNACGIPHKLADPQSRELVDEWPKIQSNQRINGQLAGL